MKTRESVHIGKQLRKLRIRRGDTIERLGKILGVTYQQTQKYETGMSRIRAVSLYKIAQHYRVDMNYFFDGLDNFSLGKIEHMPADVRRNIEIKKKLELVDDERLIRGINELLDAVVQDA